MLEPALSEVERERAIISRTAASAKAALPFAGLLGVKPRVLDFLAVIAVAHPMRSRTLIPAHFLLRMIHRSVVLAAFARSR